MNRINICIVHYNTPKITECLVRSINKNVPCCNIYIFDNSDKYPFVYRQDNITVFDNTKSQIIDFDAELKKYPNKKKDSVGRFISFNHCISVDTCMKLIGDNFILLDSDVLLLKDITDVVDNDCIYVGESEKQNGNNVYRILPYMCFINVKMCNKYNVTYFNDKFMTCIDRTNKTGMLYDTGAYFRDATQRYKHKEIKIGDYITHYKGGSWDYTKPQNVKIHGNLSPEMWCIKNKNLWRSSKNDKVIYKFISDGKKRLFDLSYVNVDFDYVCFSDNVKYNGLLWDVRSIPDELKCLTDKKQKDELKINPNRYLGEYKMAVYIDEDVDVCGDIDKCLSYNMSKCSKDVIVSQNMCDESENDKKTRKVIYTCITGNYDYLEDPTVISSDFDYVCFSDTVTYSGNLWKIRPIPNELKSLTDVKQQRIIKICPHKYLSEYDISLWVDANIDILVDVNEYISTYCSDETKSVFIPYHPHRDCIYKEGSACIKYKKETKDVIDALMSRYKSEGYPENYGLVQTGVMIRRHNDPYCISLMDLWAKELTNNSHRDQLSFNYCLWINGDQGFVYLPSKTFGVKNFRILGHNKKRKPNPILDVVKAQKNVIVCDNTESTENVVYNNNVKTFIMDNGYSLNATKYKDVFKEFGDVEIVKCDEHRFSNGYKKIIDAVNSGEYRYIISVRSNVNLFGISRIGDEIIRKLKSITRGNKNVGIYTPSFNYASGARNPSVRKQREGERCVDLIGDGFFILDTSYVNSLPVYDFSRCPSGHGFVEILCDKVTKNGGKIIVDDSLYVSSSYIRTFNIDTLEQHRKALFRYNADIDK